MDDQDFDYKIKWFFDRIEQQASENQPVEKPQAPQKDDFETSDANNQSTTAAQESSYSSHPIESDSHSTNEDSSSHDENTTVLGKRQQAQEEVFTCNKRQKIDEETKDNSSYKCIFPQFDKDFADLSAKKRLAKL